MQKTDKSGHNQGTMTMSDRLEKDNVRHWGDLTEICTYDFNFKIPRTDIKKALSIIETYYRFRNLTEHWDAIVDPLNKTYSTVFLLLTYQQKFKHQLSPKTHFFIRVLNSISPL